MIIANSNNQELIIRGESQNFVAKMIKLVSQYNILTAMKKISQECEAALSYEDGRYVVELQQKAS